MTFFETNYLAEALSFRSRPVIGVHLNQSSARLCAKSNIDLLHFLRSLPPYQVPNALTADYINCQGRRMTAALNNLQFRFYLIEDLISIPLRISQTVTPTPDQAIVAANDALLKSAIDELIRNFQASSFNSVSSLSVSLYSSTIEKSSSDTLRDLACAYAGAGFAQFRCFEHNFLDNPIGYIAVCSFTDSRDEKIEAIKKITISLPAVLQGAISGMSDNDVCLTLLVIDSYPTDRSTQYIDPGLHNELTRYKVKPLYFNVQLFQQYVMEPATSVNMAEYLQSTHVTRYYEYLFSTERAAADQYNDIPWSPEELVPAEGNGRKTYARPTSSKIITKRSDVLDSFMRTVYAFYLKTILLPFISAKLFNLSESCEESVSVGRKVANILTGHHASAKQAARTVPAHTHLSQGKAFYTKYPVEYRVRRLADLLLQCNLLDDALIYYEALLPKQKNNKVSTPFVAEAYEGTCTAILRKYFHNYSFDNSTIDISSEDSSKIIKFFTEALRIVNECLTSPVLGHISLANASLNSPFRIADLSASFPLPSADTGATPFTPTPMFQSRTSIYRLFDFKRYLEIFTSLAFASLGQSFQLIDSTFAYTIPHSCNSTTAALSYLVNSFLLCEAQFIRRGAELAFRAGSLFFGERLFNLAYLCLNHAFISLDRPHLLPTITKGWWFRDLYESELLYCRTRALRSERFELQNSQAKDPALIDVLTNKITHLLKSTTSQQMATHLFYSKNIAAAINHAPALFSDPSTPIGACFASLQRLFISNQIAVPQLMSLFCLPFSTAKEVEERSLRFCIKNLTPPVRNVGETPLQYTVRLFGDLIQSTNEDSESHISAFLTKAFTPARKFIARDYLADLLTHIIIHLPDTSFQVIPRKSAEKIVTLAEEVKVPNISVTGLYHPNISLPSLILLTTTTVMHPAELLQCFTYQKLAKMQLLDQLNNIKVIRAGETAMVIFCLSNEYPMLDYDIKRIDLSLSLFDESNRPLPAATLEMKSKNAIVIPKKIAFVSGSILLCGIPIILPADTRNVTKMEIRGIRIAFLPTDSRSMTTLPRSTVPVPAKQRPPSTQALTVSTVPNDGTVTQQTEILLDTPVSFPVIAHAADIVVSHVLPNEPVKPGQLIHGHLVVKNMGQREVSTFYITSSHQAYCVYEHEACLYLDEVQVEGEPQSKPEQSSLVVSASLEQALDFIFSSPQVILSELEHIVGAPHEPSILKLDLARPYLKKVLQRCIVVLSMPALLQDKVCICRKALRPQEVLSIPILLMIPLSAQPGKLSIEHYLGYTVNNCPIVSEVLTELLVIPAAKPRLSGQLDLPRYDIASGTSERQYRAQLVLSDAQPKLSMAILSKPCIPPALCRLDVSADILAYTGQFLCKSYKDTLYLLQQHGSTFAPTKQNSLCLPSDIFVYEDLVAQSDSISPSLHKSLLRLHKNLTAMYKRADAHKYGPTLLSKAYNYLKKQSSFTFQDRNDATCNLTVLHKAIVEDLKTVQHAVLETYTQEYCSTVAGDFIAIYKLGESMFLYRENVPVTRRQSSDEVNTIAAKIQCISTTGGKIRFNLVIVNQSLSSMKITSSAEIIGPTDLFFIVGLQTILGEIKPFEVLVIPFMACASAVGECTITTSISANAVVGSVSKKIRVVDCGMKLSLIVT